MAFEVGQRVGDYEIVQLLGVGGMGHVYRVRNVISDRTEAMKVLLPDLTAERDLAIRFISEIRTLAGFDHPNIALLHTAFQSDNQLIMMMEFVEGSTLEQRAHQGPMTLIEVTGYTSQALAALSYAHSRGVVHRDIKPANVMLTSHGVVKLMDFGIAKSNVETHLTRPGTTIGSLYYMSPEQVRGDAVHPRSDLYSVGIMLYELVAGRRPFEAETTFSILNQQLNSPPQPPVELNPALPPALNSIILRALAKAPADRFQTADEFREALRPFCTAGGSQPRPAAAAPPAAIAAALTAADAAIPSSTASAPPPPPFADIPMAPPPRPIAYVPPPRNSKALWIATGVVAAILAMVGLAVGLPRLLGTHAAESAPPEPAQRQSDGTPVSSSQPDVHQTDIQQNAGTPNPSSYPSTQGTAGKAPAQRSASPEYLPGPAAANATPHRPAYTAGNSAPPAENAPASSQPHSVERTNPSASELNETRDRLANLSARAAAVESTLAGLRRQQEAAGYGLRGDMEAAGNRLGNNLRAADSDLHSSDPVAAAKHLDRAEGDLATLEKFLGR